MDDNIIYYMAAMTIANQMLDTGAITRKEFVAFEAKMLRKYNLPECSLYRDFHLLYPSSRGNMAAAKEVGEWKNRS